MNVRQTMRKEGKPYAVKLTIHTLQGPAITPPPFFCDTARDIEKHLSHAAADFATSFAESPPPYTAKRKK